MTAASTPDRVEIIAERFASRRRVGSGRWIAEMSGAS